MRKGKIKVYIDTSVYNRPFDDQDQTRIRLETEAFLSIMEKAVAGAIIIISSSALSYEIDQNPFDERRERISSYLSIALKSIRLNDSIKKKAVLLENRGIDSIDALHLSYAEFGNVEYFLTCDDGIIKKTRKVKELFKMKICNPIDFIIEEVLKNA